ncbi:MAG: methionine adenosyltransferase [Acholeplasmatales bacterium]
MNKKLFTSESVTKGHPDKVADRISDAILDAILRDDPHAHVAVETLVTTGLVLVSGEINTTTYVDIDSIVRKTVKSIGYTRGKYGFDADNLAVLTSISSQSEDIRIGVEKEDGNIGAGDQGLMFGFACNETKNYMPLPIFLAHELVKRLDFVREKKILPYLRPDGKAQVTLEYDENDLPVRVEAIVISSQHKDDISLEDIKADLKKEVIEAVIPRNLLDKNSKIFINPTGKFTIGGPKGDTGLTGRKIIVDTYGGYSRHGGGAFSGKDPTKVDRSASYMARYLAKNIVASGIAGKCEVQLAYVIGVEKPVSVRVDTFNTSKVKEEKIVDAIIKNVDLSPKGIIERFDLRKPIYENLSNYGHFGRTDLNVKWELLDIVAIFKDLS